MKTKIWEFDPVIYSLHLWVAKELRKDDVDGLLYKYENDDELTEFSEEFFSRNTQATTAVACKKCKDNHWEKGLLVILRQPKTIGAGVCAHEALHVTDYICEFLGIISNSFGDDEARAYIIQWVTNCIWGVLIGEASKMKGVVVK